MIWVTSFLPGLPYPEAQIISQVTSANSKPWETMGRRATGLKEANPLMFAEPPENHSLAAICFFSDRRLKMIGSTRNSRAWQVGPSLGAFTSFLVLFTLFAIAPSAHAANVVFSPSTVSMEGSPGDLVEFPVSMKFTTSRGRSGFANISLTTIGGNLDRSWVAGDLNFNFSDTNPIEQRKLFIRIPADAASGTYKANFSAEVVNSSEYVYQVNSLAVNVEVLAPSCNQPPELIAINSSDQVLDFRNNKPAEFTFSGTVSVGEECEEGKMSYQLIDEYGEFDTVEPITMTESGDFEVIIPVFAARKGSDKDGRLYTIVFTAENEAGVTKSDEFNILVSHDNRKKK